MSLHSADHQPSSGQTSAIILGASRWPRMSATSSGYYDRASCEQSVKSFRLYLADAARALGITLNPDGTFHSTAVVDLFNQDLRPGDLVEAVKAHMKAQSSQHNLIIYFVGHGCWYSKRKSYRLVPYGGEPNELIDSTTLDPAQLVDLFPETSGWRVYLIIDACLSGHAVHLTQSNISVLCSSLPHEGASAEEPSDDPAQARTLFTGSLVDVLSGQSENDPKSSGRLSPDELRKRITNLILLRHRGPNKPPCPTDPPQGPSKGFDSQPFFPVVVPITTKDAPADASNRPFAPEVIAWCVVRPERTAAMFRLS